MEIRKKKIIDENLNINKILTVSKNYQTVRANSLSFHYPNHDVLAYIVEGTRSYEFDGKLYTASPGDLVFVPRTETYKRHLDDGILHTMYVDFLFDVPDKTTLSPQVFSNIPDIDVLFKKLYKTWIAKSPAFYPASLGLLYSIYSSIISHHIRAYVSKSSRRLLEDAQKAFMDNYANPDFSINDFTSQANVSLGYFREVFKSVYEMSPHQYIILLRINRAKELLESSDLSLEEIAYQLNFSHFSHFSATFKQKTGFSPSEYRKIFHR